MSQYELPMVALRGLTVLPDMIIHFDLSREVSKKSVEYALNEEQKIFLVMQKDIEEEKPDRQGLYDVGTVAFIKQVVKLPNNIERVMVEGCSRARLIGLDTEETEYLKATVEDIFENDDLADAEEEALIRSLKELAEAYLRFYPKVGKGLKRYFEEDNKLSFIMNQVMINFPFSNEQKQELLEIEDIKEQCEQLITLIMNEAQIAAIRTQLAVNVKEKIDKNQKEYILREQLEYIKEELGDKVQYSDTQDLEEKLEKLKASDEVKEKIKKEIARLKMVAGASSESVIERVYIETLLDMPWDKVTKDTNDIEKAQEILDNAVNQANTLKLEASKYTEDRLAEMESILEGSISQADANYRSLLTTLVQYRDVIHANREAMSSASVYDENSEGDDIAVSEE